ncbi:ATP-binding protein [Patescibacteria group bacterium]|nr:ATP-binding protein [Patescibacteria group bacterium]
MRQTVNNWYVITGGPSSGKTTVLNELAKLGYITIPDAARALIDKEMSEGKTLEEIRKDEVEFQRKILKIKIGREKRIPKNKIVFFDNAIPCSIAYYQICGLDSKEVIRLCQEQSYRKIFFLEQFSFKKDYARAEDKQIANKLSKLLKESYENLGYEVIDISVMSTKNRVQKILAEVKKN